MLSVVLTGPAIDNEGRSIIRENLINACHQTGYLTVGKRVSKDTDFLVASRTDTIKAITAAERGVAVLTYPEFINRYLKGVDIAIQGKPNRYTDKINPDLLVPDFTDGFSAADLL